jgi:hypothetical protein
MGDPVLQVGADVSVDSAIAKSGYSKSDQAKLQTVALAGKAVGNSFAMFYTAISLGAAAKFAPQPKVQSDRPTFLYQMVSAKGEHLKYGVTVDPAGRYSPAELAGAELRILANGPRPEMLYLERLLHETMPIGPREGQSAYIQIQVDKGYVPPSQYPIWDSSPTK